MVNEVKAEVNKEVVDILKSLLDEAETGLIQGVAVAGIHSDAATFNVFSSYMPMHLLGELRVLERDMMDLHIDCRRKPCWEYCE